jgi:peptide/nickel transport system substrate-binding protein
MPQTPATTPAPALTRRAFLQGATAVGVGALLGSSPSQVLAQKGGALRVQQVADIVNVNPYLSRAAVDRVVADTIFGGLAAYDRDMRPIPELAESWTIPDDRTYVFKLRRGVTFHNGRPATAEDVKWSIEKIYEVGAKGQWANYIAGIAKIDVLDAATVKFTMEKPNAVLLNGLPVAAIIPRESYETIDTNPVGLGPYRFVERIPGQYLRVAKSEKYWDQSTNYPDQITFSFATEESTQVANLQSGIVDMHGWLPISRVAELRQNPRFRLHDTGEGTLGWLGVLLNTARSPLDNKKLRQAIAHGIDKAAIHKSVFAGLGTPDNGYLPTGHWAHVPDAELGGYRFDPARAKALLAEAGHPNGLELTWSIGTLLPEFTRYAELAQADLAKVGIRIKLRSMEWATYVQEVTGQRNFELASDGFGGRADPDLQLGVAFGPTSSGNKMRWTPPRAAELFELGRGTTNQARRKQHYTELQRLLVDDVPAIRICSFPTVWGAVPKVAGIQVNAEGRIRWHKLSVSA